MLQSQARDKTQDFLAIFQQVQQQQKLYGVASDKKQQPSPIQVNTQVTPTNPRLEKSNAQLLQQRQEFNKQASQIALGISNISQRLQRLMQMIKKSSIFEDYTPQINQLTGAIKQELDACNHSIVQLQTNLQSKSQNNNTFQEKHHTVVVDNLRTRLKNTTKDFQGILEVRKDALQKQQSRKQMYSNTSTQEEFRPLRNRTKLQQENIRASTSQQGEIDIEAGQQIVPSNQHRPSFMQSQEQQQLIQQEQQDSYLTSRHEALRNIQKTILELGGIFQQLSVMVQEQGEMAVRIDDNVNLTLANVEGAQNQLLKYLNSISSNRWLMLKIFGVLIVFLIIFVIFVV